MISRWLWSAVSFTFSSTQVLFHGNILTYRDMTDVADSSRVMVDLIEVPNSVNVYCRHAHDKMVKLVMCRLLKPGPSTTCAATGPLL
jgi:hypothetical protein